MVARISVADQHLRLSVEILFAHLYALPESRRGWRIQYLHAASWTNGHLNPVKACAGLLASRADRPHLTWRQWIGLNGILAA